MKARKIQKVESQNGFFPERHNTACREQFLLLQTGFDTVKYPCHGALIFYARPRWSVDLLETTLPTGEVLPGLLSRPSDPTDGGRYRTSHKTRNALIGISGFAPGFFEGKPRCKKYITKHLRKH